MSRNEAEHAINGTGPISRGFGFMLWVAALSLVAMTGFAQVEKIAGTALTVAEQAVGRDVAYLAVVVMFAAMGFAWWMAKQMMEAASQSAVSTVETARALQRLADLIEERVPQTMIGDEGTAKLLQIRSKNHDR